MNYDAANPSVADEQIRAATDREEREIFASAKANDIGEGTLIARLDPELRRATNAQRGVLRERLIKADFAFRSDDLLQLLGDDEIARELRQLLVHVPRAKTQNEIARLECV